MKCKVLCNMTCNVMCNMICHVMCNMMCDVKCNMTHKIIHNLLAQCAPSLSNHFRMSILRGLIFELVFPYCTVKIYIFLTFKFSSSFQNDIKLLYLFWQLHKRDFKNMILNKSDLLTRDRHVVADPCGSCGGCAYVDMCIKMCMEKSWCEFPHIMQKKSFHFFTYKLAL